MRRLSGLAPAVAIVVVFFASGILTLHHYGTTWDEQESYSAGTGNIRLMGAVLTGKPAEWPWHEIRGYQFTFDTMRAVVAVGLNRLFWVPGSIYGFHAFNLLVASAVLLLVFLTARAVSGNPVIGVLSVAALAIQPKFLAHSQANPKDLIGVFVITLTVWLAESATRSRKWAPVVLLGAGLGFALANHVASLVLYPLTGLWLLLACRTNPLGSFARVIVSWVVSLPVAFICWPWIWSDTGRRVGDAITHVRTFSPTLLGGVLYLGRIYDIHSVPWHYAVVTVIAATPLLLVAAIAAGVVRIVEDDARIRRLVVLALLWAGSVFAAEAFAAAHYDGARHVLAALPALAMLAATGASWFTRAAGELVRARRRALAISAVGVLVVLLGYTMSQLVAVHPYYDAYLNEGVRAAVGPHAEDAFELEYWGLTYKEASTWLDENAPRDAVISVPMAPHAIAPWLRRDMRLSKDVQLSTADTRPYYVVVMTRRAYYDSKLNDIRKSMLPVFVVTRQRSTLLEVYRLDATSHR